MARPKTGGRKAGMPNKRTLELEAARDLAMAKVIAAGMKVFEGDALALHQVTYRNLDLPLMTRLAAAAIAIRYEKPALASVQHGGKDGGPIEGRITVEFVDPPKRRDRGGSGI